MDNTTVSVIVPIYNTAKYLRVCLDSIKRQTYKNIEVILINDGSTDDSDSIAQEYNNNFGYVLVNRDNGGLSAARNSGLDIASGEYVYFLDGDDFLSDDAIEKLYKKAKEENLDQLRFSAYSFEDGTEDYKWTTNISDGGYKYKGDYKGVVRGIDFYKKTIENNDYFPSCCLIFTKREVIKKNNLRFYEGILNEDNLFNFELTSLCDRVSLLNEPLYYRRVRAGSITMTDNWFQKNRSMCISAMEADRFIDEHQEIKEIYGKWQISFFLNMMLQNWNKMCKEQQKSNESIEYFNKVKPLMNKYHIGGISIKLFYMSRYLYRLYSWMIVSAGKILHSSI